MVQSAAQLLMEATSIADASLVILWVMVFAMPIIAGQTVARTAQPAKTVMMEIYVLKIRVRDISLYKIMVSRP